MIRKLPHRKHDEIVCRPHKRKRKAESNAAPAKSRYFAIRGVIERMVAVLLFVIFLPVLLICMAMVRLTSPGPAIFRQTRTGTGGRPFVMYKLRSMINDVEKVSGKRWSTPGDPRVTPVGRFLRLTHLDEIPQLINVIRGEMSLIGPRPERPEFVQKLKKKIERYDERHSINPGITGLAQIYLPPDVDLNSVKRKTRLDLHYLENAGFLMDARILFCTALRILAVRGGVGPKISGLDRQIEDIRRALWSEKADMKALKRKRRKVDSRLAAVNGTSQEKSLRVDAKNELPLHIEVRRSRPLKVKSDQSGESNVDGQYSGMQDSNDFSSFAAST